MGRGLWTVEQAAQWLQVSRATAYRLISEEGLPVVRIPGRGGRTITRISPDQLEAWLRDRCGAGAPRGPGGDAA